MSHDLTNSVRIYRNIREQLMMEHNLLPDDQCLTDTLEGLTDIHDIIAAIVRESIHAKAMAEALRTIIADNQARKLQLETKNERLRALALYALTETGISRVDAPDMTITKSNGTPHVIITDEAAVPDALCKIERTPKKKKIAEELKNKDFVPYAMFSNSEPVLKVHTK